MNLGVGEVILDAEASRYVVKVHRQRAGQRILLFDPSSGLQGEAVIKLDRLPHICALVEAVEAAPSSTMPVTLAVGVGKSDKPDQAFRDVTAFGAEELVLVQAARSIAKADSKARTDRLLRVAQQVARQCGRASLPELRGPLCLKDVLEQCPPDQLKLICAFHEEGRPLLDFTSELARAPSVLVLVGPEGGFSADELSTCLEAGCQAVDLGPFVLRTESAVSACLAVLRAAYLCQ